MDKASVVIIGGGVLGTSVAYHLTMQGENSVVLLERLDLGAAASSLAAGLVFRISTKPAVDRLSSVTFGAISALEDQLGGSLDFRRHGTLRVTHSREGRTSLQEVYRRAMREGLSAELVDKKWCSGVLPWLSMMPDDIGAFVVTEEGAQWDALLEAEQRVASFFPGLATTSFEGYVAGLSAYTPDGGFIVGKIEDRPGLYAAAGCCGSGVMASGGIGEALAGMILNGESPHDLTPFRPDRFGNVDPVLPAFRDRCAAARARKAK